MMRRGSTGPDVVAWQAFLRSEGYTTIAADGVFGVATEIATRELQRARGLTPDGIVGPATLAAARGAAAPSSAPSSARYPVRLSAAGRALIKSFEGLRLTAYPDDGWSIGYGHHGATEGQTITQAEADRLFDADVARFERAVATAITRGTQWEFDALVSLAYNIGTDGFTRSTVLRRHNAGDTTGAADAILMWNQDNGRVLPVLERRREKERQIYLHGHDGSATPAPAAPSSRAMTALLVLAGAGLLWLRWR
jgi:lysozyme